MPNQCPHCLRNYEQPGHLSTHQRLTGHWDAPIPNATSSDVEMADEEMAGAELQSAGSPAPSSLSHSDHAMQTASDSGASASGPSHASTGIPVPSDHSEHGIDNPDDPAPYGVATNEDELRASIRKLLEDMIKQNTNVNTGHSEPSSSVRLDSETGGPAERPKNRFVTMRKLPEDIDEAVSQFLSHLLHEEHPPVDAGLAPDAGLDPGTEDEATSEVFGDTCSEPGSDLGSEQFYTAANNSADDLIGRFPSKPEPDSLPDIPDNMAHTPWGTPLRRCQPMLEKIFRDRVADGRSPDWPFADYLEFEFVKWMV
ncbi:hypothetical protein BDV93DRAFT_562525, partial [Ceratobasidium sp. AG-I]